jgi:cytochrome c553
MLNSLRTFVGPGVMLFVAFLVAGERQPSAAQAPPAAAQSATTDGIPVSSDEVKRVCGTCHASDAQGRMTRISYRRATPENWELTIRRMAALNNAPVTPEQARSILKYLADNHGLAPEEARPIMFEADRSMIDFTYTANTDTHNLCNKCHSMGRVLSERRTAEEWKLLISMHRGVYPGIDGGSGGFRSGGGGGAGRGAGRGAARQPMDLATDHLSTAFPLMTTDWASWSAAKRPTRLAGKWTLSQSPKWPACPIRSPRRRHSPTPRPERRSPVRDGDWSTPDSSGAVGPPKPRRARMSGGRCRSSSVTRTR